MASAYSEWKHNFTLNMDEWEEGHMGELTHYQCPSSLNQQMI